MKTTLNSWTKNCRYSYSYHNLYDRVDMKTSVRIISSWSYKIENKSSMSNIPCNVYITLDPGSWVQNFWDLSSWCIGAWFSSSPNYSEHVQAPRSDERGSFKRATRPNLVLQRILRFGGFGYRWKYMSFLRRTWQGITWTHWLGQKITHGGTTQVVERERKEVKKKNCAHSESLKYLE